MNDTSKRRRLVPRFRFGLRSTLFAVAVFAIAFGWVGWEVKEVRDRRAGIRKIRELGGIVSYDFQRVPGTGEGRDVSVFSSGRQRESSWKRTLFGNDYADVVVAIDLFGDHVTDKDIAVLKNFSDLRYLTIKSRGVTDTSMDDLCELPKLKVLSVRNAPITDEGILRLGSLNELIGLGLINTQVTNEGVSQLQRRLPKCYIKALGGCAEERALREGSR
jgi:hypothetical protein